MKINIVKDKAGTVIATFENAVGDGPAIVPEVDHTHTVHQIEVAEDYRHNIEAVYKQHSSM